MFEAAGLVGEALRASFGKDAQALKNHSIDFNASILLGGQIKGEKPR